MPDLTAESMSSTPTFTIASLIGSHSLAAAAAAAMPSLKRKISCRGGPRERTDPHVKYKQRSRRAGADFGHRLRRRAP